MTEESLSPLERLVDALVPPFVKDAACAQIAPDTWFPEGQGSQTKKAKDICDNFCRVREQCLEYAVTNHINFGIWGGTSPRQRRDIRRARGIAEAEDDDLGEYDD